MKNIFIYKRSYAKEIECLLLLYSNYLVGNPLAVDRRRTKRNKSKPNIIDRHLELDEINAVLEALSNYPTPEHTQQLQVTRARYIILLLFYIGLHIAEAPNHNMGNFVQRSDNWFSGVNGDVTVLKNLIFA